MTDTCSGATRSDSVCWEMWSDLLLLPLPSPLLLIAPPSLSASGLSEEAECCTLKCSACTIIQPARVRYNHQPPAPELSHSTKSCSLCLSIWPIIYLYSHVFTPYTFWTHLDSNESFMLSIPSWAPLASGRPCLCHPNSFLDGLNC